MNDDFMASMSGLLGGFQSKLQALKEEAANIEMTATAGGKVTATATGDGRLVSLQIAPDALDDRELLEDMITAAVNEALRKGAEAAASRLATLTAGLGLPPGMLS